mmetsp:Transcript_25662/g.43488  ORF Transcript_25662/g.43488 Transcript_25662/m.43488 type:complete len:80 (-) Transcript_25662:42-281(-)
MLQADFNDLCFGPLKHSIEDFEPLPFCIDMTLVLVMTLQTSLKVQFNLLKDRVAWPRPLLGLGTNAQIINIFDNIRYVM